MNFLKVLMLLLAGTASWATAADSDVLPDNLNYTFIYFENGYPIRLKGGRRPQNAGQDAARERPDLVVQTGFYSLRLNCKTMQLTGYDALKGSDYLTALNEDVTVFSPAELVLTLEKDGVEYTCTSGVVQDEKKQYVRLIESGQYVQRFDHIGLVFQAKNGAVLNRAGRFEVTAWPEHVVFTLDCTDVPGVQKTGIKLTSPQGKVYQVVAKEDQVGLMLQPHLDQDYEPLKASDYFHSAVSLSKSSKFDCAFDEAEAGLRIDLKFSEERSSGSKDRLDEFLIKVKNFSTKAQSIPLIFNEKKVIGMTGSSMLLCEEKDGRPIGIPVQISKDWHTAENGVHKGPWLRGYTMMPLKSKETKTVRLRVVTGYWGGVPAVSYAQLSVIGYGGNWKWDESALGSWGESMCYDPSQHLGGSFIADVRPAFVTGKNGKTHDWTENAGGGDFLIYFDRDGVYHCGKKLKTAYHWTGPNLTEVLYSGVTDDDRIRFNYRIRSVRTADYHRRFQAYRYEFMEEVSSPERLVFHQMGADYYNSAKFEKFYCGNRSGLDASYDRPSGERGYDSSSIAFKDSWLAIDDTAHSGGNAALTGRGILSLSSQLNGWSLPLSLYCYSANGRSTTFDLSAKSVSKSYKKRDVVEGEVEFIMPPKSAHDYWEADSEFKNRLETYQRPVWQAVADEYKQNVQLTLLMTQGKLLNNYPVEIQAVPADDGVLADFTVKRGGIGYLPVILRGVPAEVALSVERQLDGKWVPLESVDHNQNNYYQGFLAVDGTLDCAFNISRFSSDLDKSWRVRILAKK